MKAVIENGNLFSKAHFFMMAKEIKVQNIEESLASYLRIVVDELGINQFEFADFLHEIQITHPLLFDSYNQMKCILFNFE